MKIRILGVFVVLAVNVSLATPLSIKARHVEKTFELDGYLEGYWQDIPAFDSFTMVEPVAGGTPSERTEIRVAYDQENLYVGIHCFDSDPKAISAFTLAHDQFDEHNNSDDLVRILLDPFQDKRNGYVFVVNPAGARSDGFALGEHVSLNWDGIWDARCQILSSGWSAEIVIPFKTLSFNPELEVWGINAERYIPRKLETIRLAGASPDQFFYNPVIAAPLKGITNIRQGRGLTIRPYTAAREGHRDPGQPRDWQSEAGVDIYQNFTPNFVGALSYNTDFAETEVDARQINITRFPLLFPEKRTFFLEGSNIFEFGTMNEYLPFFSRTMGLYQGEAVPIQIGAKLFGKINNTNMAFVGVQTESAHEPELDAERLVAGRISQNILESSHVGMIFTHGDPAGRGRNSLLGADFRYATSKFRDDKNFSVDLWGVHNWNTIVTGRHHAAGFKIDYPNDLWDMFLMGHSIGDAMQPALGYVRRPGVHNLSVKIDYGPRPHKGWIGRHVRRFQFRTNASAFWDMNGNVETAEWRFVPLSFTTENGYDFGFGLTPTRDVLKDEFEISEGISIPPGTYDFLPFEVEMATPSFKAIALEAAYQFGEFYTGRLYNVELEGVLKAGGNLNLSLSANLVRGLLTQGDFSENVYRIKAELFASPDLGLYNYIQYDDVSRELGANIRLRWQIRPGNTIFVVYNKNWERTFHPQSRFRTLEENAVLKVQLSWRP